MQKSLPSDKEASLLAEHRDISFWAEHTTGQQSTQLLGTQQHVHANQACVPGKSGPSLTAIFATSVELSSTEKHCMTLVMQNTYNVLNDSLYSLIMIYFLLWLHLHNNYIM